MQLWCRRRADYDRGARLSACAAARGAPRPTIAVCGGTSLLEELIGDRLIAAEAICCGVTAAELLEKEVNAKVQITDAEMGTLIDANKSQWRGTPGELHDRVR